MNSGPYNSKTKLVFIILRYDFQEEVTKSPGGLQEGLAGAFEWQRILWLGLWTYLSRDVPRYRALRRNLKSSSGLIFVNNTVGTCWPSRAIVPWLWLSPRSRALWHLQSFMSLPSHYSKERQSSVPLTSEVTHQFFMAH